MRLRRSSPSSGAPLLDPVRERQAPPWPPGGIVTDALFARLTAEDIAAIEQAVEGTARDYWFAYPGPERMRLALSFAAYYDVAEPLEHTRLTGATPPEDVHAMARGPLAGGGDAGIADLVVGALEQCGVTLDVGATVLDFGCSSGRVLRALAAWREDLRCVGCDPNAGAIAWADAHLPMARFFVSPERPPLELADASVDAAFAISIWSHFGAGAARLWLQEMHRVVKPGGHLLVTTHGFDAIGDHVRGDAIGTERAATIVASMLRDGFAFYDVFGQDGDWGVKDDEWGQAYMTLEWLAEHATPDWSVRSFRPGLLTSNQDVTLLERVA